MPQKNKNDGANPGEQDQRTLMIAYLSYAVEDVGALDEDALHLLEMTIALLRRDIHPDNVQEPEGSLSRH